jgi:hypothetical protein
MIQILIDDKCKSFLLCLYQSTWLQPRFEVGRRGGSCARYSCALMIVPMEPADDFASNGRAAVLDPQRMLLGGVCARSGATPFLWDYSLLR